MKKKTAGVIGLSAKIGLKVLSMLGKLMKATKFLKFGLAAASFASYSIMFTWKFAVLLMISLAWHESGHVWAMRKMGIKTKGFYFIPFLGGAAIAEENYKTYGQNSFIAIMGPIWGLILSIICCAAYYATGIQLLAAAAGWMALLNLFNLFPVVPLDGGQIVRSIAFSIHKNLGFVFLVVSLIAAIIIMIQIKAALFAFLIFIGIIDLIVEFFRRKSIDGKYKRYTELAESYKETEDSMSYNYCKRKAGELKLVIPTSMSKIQLAQSLAVYGLIVAALIIIIKLMGSIPGADLAAEFLADK